MKRLNLNLSQIQKALLFILPLIYFIAGSYFRNLPGNFSLCSCDLEYICYMSGLTHSDGAIKNGYVDFSQPNRLFMRSLFLCPSNL
jgi:hypothetical protein